MGKKNIINEISQEKEGVNQTVVGYDTSSIWRGKMIKIVRRNTVYKILNVFFSNYVFINLEIKIKF